MIEDISEIDGGITLGIEGDDDKDTIGVDGGRDRTGRERTVRVHGSWRETSRVAESQRALMLHHFPTLRFDFSVK